MPELPDTSELQDAALTAEQAAEALSQVQDQLPAIMLVVFAGMVVTGLVLWLLGGVLARAACVVSGLILGGLAGWLVGALLAGQGAFTLPLVLGGSIIGALLAGLLFRIWVAGTGAVVLALVVPIASLVWNGATVEPVSFDSEEAIEDVKPEEGEDESIVGWANRAMDEAHQQLSDDVEGWWEGLGGSGRSVAIMGALIGAAIGLGLGMLLPKLSAAFQTAIAGSLLIYLGGVGLIKGLLGSEVGFLPDTPRSALITIGLITVLGTVIQWTVFQRQTDK